MASPQQRLVAVAIKLPRALVPNYRIHAAGVVFDKRLRIVRIDARQNLRELLLLLRILLTLVEHSKHDVLLLQIVHSSLARCAILRKSYSGFESPALSATFLVVEEWRTSTDGTAGISA